MISKEFYGKNGYFKDEKRGKCSGSIYLMMSMKAAMFVHENGRKRGEANLNAKLHVCSQWVNNDLQPSNNHLPNLSRMTSVRTATHWLHRLGFINIVIRKTHIFISTKEKMSFIAYS